MNWTNFQSLYWKVIIAFSFVLLLCSSLIGCVEVGGGSSSSGAEVCSGTECSDGHDESNNSTDNSS